VGGDGEVRPSGSTFCVQCNFFIFKVVKAHVASSPKHPETLHYTGNGVFCGVG
jgi:hypothetical protein